MRWILKPASPHASLEVPGGVLRAERGEGTVRLSFHPSMPSSWINEATIAHWEGNGDLSVRLAPPKTNVIVKMDPPFVMIPESAILLGVDLPLDVVVEDSEGVLYWEFRSSDYRKGWSGGLEGGEASLALKRPPRIIDSPTDARAEGDKAGMSVHISNLARHRMTVSKFIVPARNLRLFSWKDGILCDGVSIVYDQEGDAKTLIRGLRSMCPDKSFKLLDEARESQQEVLLRKGKRFLKSITG